MKKFLTLLFGLLIFNLSFSFDIDILEKDVVPGSKFSQTIRIYPENNKFPNEEDMRKIALGIKQRNAGYSNYFIHFILPNMPLNEGSFATASNKDNDNNNMDVTILYHILEYDNNYSKYVDTKDGVYFLRNLDNPKNKETKNNKTMPWENVNIN